MPGKKQKTQALGVSSPIKKPAKDDSLQIPIKISQLAFINREEEAFLIAYNCLQNATKDVSGKLVLVTSGQMYGSGKTEMGKNATKALKVNERQVSRLAKLYTHDLVNKYINSEYVLVDLTYLVQPTELLPTFALALAYLTYCSFAKFIEKSSYDPTQKEFLDLKLFSIRDVVVHYSKMYNKHYFIHWDEVGRIENNAYNPFMDVSWSPISDKDDEYDLKTRLVRYYDFWSNITTILSLKFAYSFCTSKTPAFSLLGLKLLPAKESPTDHRHIVLGGLSASSILLAMQNTQVFEDTSILTHLCIPEKLVQYFCDIMYDRTKGLPRLVHRALEGLCNHRGPLNTEQDILNAIDNIAYNYIINRRGEEIFVKESVLQPAWYTIYVSLIIASLLNTPMNKSSVVTVGDQKINLLDVIERLDLFIEPTTNSESIKIVFPQYVLRHFSMLQKNFKVADVRLPLISPILENAAVLGLGGEPLEWLNKVILGFTLAQCKGRLWKEALLFLADSELLNDVAFKFDEDQPVSYLPAIKPDATSRLDDGIRSLINSNVWRKQAPPSDWPNIMKYLFKVNTIGHPAPKSHSPDLLFNTEQVILAFADKLNSHSNPITWADLNEEIEKASYLTSVKPVCLILVALHLGTEIQNALGNQPYLFLPANHWGYHNKRLDTVGARHSAYKFSVPTKMEVVILGDGGLRSFLGSVNLDALKKFVEDRLDIASLCDSLLPKLTIPLPQTKSKSNKSETQTIKIAKKSGGILCAYTVTPNMSVGDLIAAVSTKVPSTALQTKTISLRNSPDSTTEFSPTSLVADLNNITDSTLYLILEDIQSIEDFL